MTVIAQPRKLLCECGRETCWAEADSGEPICEWCFRWEGPVL